MKWKQETDFRQSPFKLLTVSESRRASVNNALIAEPTTMSLGIHHLVTKNKSMSATTWPRPRMKKTRCRVSVSNGGEEEEQERPKTATLERPKVLDISFLGKIDMTNLTKKGLMSIANLCILPVKQEIKRSGGYLAVRRISKSRKGTPISSPSPNLKVGRRSLSEKEGVSDSEDSKSSLVVPPKHLKTPTKNNHMKVRSQGNILAREKSQDSNNNEKELKKTVHRPKTVISKKTKTVDEVFGGQIVVPEPCTTCGRPELPERLHSHPAASRVISRTPVPASPKPPTAKSTVRKPIPMKYRSDKTKRKDETEGIARESSAVTEKKDMPPKVKGPRTVVCYICGREFGTKSYPLHEPQCLQKWQRENAILPPHLQRSSPQRPDEPANSEDWNRLAHKASQALLVSCEHCGRTFNPDRLEVHLRSCRPGVKRVNPPRSPAEESSSTDTESSTTSRSGPPVVYCYICGRMFGSKSISIHEPKCLEKWRAENEQLPTNQRRPDPVRPGLAREHAASQPIPESAPLSPKASSGGGKRGRTIPCYLCGREFFAGSISIHEPQCLVKWHNENDKLSPEHRRPEPQKPDVKFTASGAVDFQGTMNAIWETHLQQLIPCKHCGRTFNPDRVDVHERACKGPRH